jgi:hypothetical protein
VRSCGFRGPPLRAAGRHQTATISWLAVIAAVFSSMMVAEQ